MTTMQELCFWGAIAGSITIIAGLTVVLTNDA